MMYEQKDNGNRKVVEIDVIEGVVEPVKIPNGIELVVNDYDIGERAVYYDDFVVKKDPLKKGR